MSSLVTVLPSSCRSRFSSRMRSENGSRVRLTPVSSSAFRRKKLYFPENEEEVSADKLLKESGCDWVDMVSSSPKRAPYRAQGVGGRSQDSMPQMPRPKSKNVQRRDGTSSDRGRGDRGGSASCWEDSLPWTSFYCDRRPFG